MVEIRIRSKKGDIVQEKRHPANGQAVWKDAGRPDEKEDGKERGSSTRSGSRKAGVGVSEAGSGIRKTGSGV